MSNQVYANNMEVSCKAAAGKSICAFPDVCFTPPQTPATPPGVPIPYPNTGMASDCSDGSRSVKISGQEVMLKNKSYFKRSTGDEAGCAPKKGLLNSKNMGKVFFKAWSMDVKVEGENVVRHFDLTTHNHASDIGNESIPWMHVDEMDIALDKDCEDEKNEFQRACTKCIKNHPDGTINRQGTSNAMCDDPDCKKAKACALLPYAIKCCKEKVKGKKKKKRKTPHHLIPNSLLQSERGNNLTNVDGLSGYTMRSAPCCCATGKSQYEDDHGKIHDKTKKKLQQRLDNAEPIDYEYVRDSACKAHVQAVKDDDGKAVCKAKCLAVQLDAYFQQRSKDGNPDNIKLRRQDGSTGKKYPPVSDGVGK
jgi:uncharacterized protein DUF4150/HNH/endonuclease VII toxin of polymorphic toxin system